MNSMRNGQSITTFKYSSIFYANSRHEHLYGSVEEKLIRSDELPKTILEMERIISGVNVILCTLSMMSNPALHDNGTFKIIPPKCLIIDESSQINVFEFLVCCILDVFESTHIFFSICSRNSGRFLKRCASLVTLNNV